VAQLSALGSATREWLSSSGSGVSNYYPMHPMDIMDPGVCRSVWTISGHVASRQAFTGHNNSLEHICHKSGRHLSEFGHYWRTLLSMLY